MLILNAMAYILLSYNEENIKQEEVKMAFIDYYKILGVKKDIPQKDVRAAYRKRAKQFHPDLHPNDAKAKAKFQALSEAYEVIGDPEKRAKYDKYGEQWRNAEAYEGFGGGWQNSGNYNTAFEGFDFGRMGGGFSSFFQDLFGGGSRGGFRKQASYGRTAPQSQEVEVSIDLYTALLGGEIVVMLPQGKKVKLKVKPYTQNGTKVRIKSKDNSGDTILKYNVKLPTVLTENQKEHLLQMRNNA